MTVQSKDAGTAAAKSITSLRTAARTFARFGSPRAILAGFALALVVRAIAAVMNGLGTGWSIWDLVAVAIVVALVPFVEWFIHLLVLHSKPRSVRGITIDPGVGHREHHLEPASLNFVLLRPLEASLFQLINAGVVVAVVGGPLWLLGVPVTGPILTGVVMAVAGLGHYEWSHYLFHTAYRPKTRYYRRLKSNHRLHHLSLIHI